MVCANCGAARATTGWIGTGCTLCAARSGYRNVPQWCSVCTLTAQLTYAQERAADVARLESELAKAKEEAK